MPATTPAFATDYWRRQEQHLAQSIRHFAAEHRRTPPDASAQGEETRHLRDAKASYDRMLADLSPDDRAVIERVMTSEMTMLMLAVASAAGDLVIAHHQRVRPHPEARAAMLRLRR